jgi:exosortase
MTAAAPAASAGGAEAARPAWLALGLGALLFAVLFARPFVTLLDDWWNNPDAGHGLLLAPVAGWLAWRSRDAVAARPARAAGLAILGAAVLLRYVSGLAAELFTMRASMLLALVGLLVYFLGMRRVLAWWLPLSLLALSVPLPEVVLNSIAMPLQLQASSMGASLLEARQVPVLVQGNIIHLPGHRLFVTEACSGLRSLTALLSLGVLAGGLWLRTPLARIGLVLTAIPVAVVLNGIRVFLTGFLVYFVDPRLGEGFMHMTEGWLLFLVAFALLGAMAWALALLEARWARR